MSDTYCNALVLKARKFDDGGEVINASVKVADMIAFLNQHGNADGWVNLSIGRRKQPSDRGVTHYAKLYAPQQRQEQTRQAPQPVQRRAPDVPRDAAIGDDTDDLPF